MFTDKNTTKIIVVGIIAGACFVASMLVLEQVAERRGRHEEAQKEVASSWGNRQEIIGPVLKIDGILKGADNIPGTYYVLPETVRYESRLAPDTLSRGIYTSTVYSAEVGARGSFAAEEIAPVLARFSRVESVRLGVAISDTRGVEKQVSFSSGNTRAAFEPGSGLNVLNGSGLHAAIPVANLRANLPFSFSFALKGSEGVAFAPVGKESIIVVSAPWGTPKFSGAFLPAERSITDADFSAEWRISSFGRSYPQTWQAGEVDFERVLGSTASVELYEYTDFYTKIDRSTKYAILFIAVTFLVLFLFETLGSVRIHPVQYLLVGASLALFYLLLLSFSEHIGFLAAYSVAAGMIALLISLYAARVLGAKGRAAGVFAMLLALYAYLYFVLLLEDYALLFGSLLLFALLATTMYLTRKVNWFELGRSRGELR